MWKRQIEKICKDLNKRVNENRCNLAGKHIKYIHSGIRFSLALFKLFGAITTEKMQVKLYINSLFLQLEILRFADLIKFQTAQI